MPGAAVGTECAINPYDLADDQVAPVEGDYIVSTAGTTYEVLEVRKVRSRVYPRRVSLRCLKLGHESDVVFDPTATVHGIEWYGRGPR
jgi:hypothetical protein